jgi:large subunit ribosomal protein L25
MASTKPLIALAKTLPAPLQRFLARYPAAAILPAIAPGAEAPKTGYQLDRPNPFKCWRHPVTNKLQDPVYSLRRQADLLKMAQEHGVAELMPESEKSAEARLAKRVEHGLRIKGTGIGQKVKGHKDERATLKKYVRIASGQREVRHVPGDMEKTDVNLQDGRQAGSYACDAETYQDMETGTLRLPLFPLFAPMLSQQPN